MKTMSTRLYTCLLVCTITAIMLSTCYFEGDIEKLRPKARVESYTVTFDKNTIDTNSTDASPKTKTVTPPASTIDTLPTDPTRTGYIFLGWNTEVNGSGTAFIGTTPVTVPITVYAQWQQIPPDSFIVTFDKNTTEAGSTDANPKTKTVIAPAITVVTLPTPPARLTGYNFTGWNTEPNGSGTVFIGTTPVTAHITVYAQWELIPPDSITVTFDKNNYEEDSADANPKTKTLIAPATTIDALPIPPTRTTEYVFNGWNTSPYGSGTIFDVDTPVTESITVYAQWKQASYGGRVAYSYDGITWIAVNDNVFSSIGVANAAWGDDKFIISTGSINYGDDIAYSSDGITWIAGQENLFGNEGIKDFAWSGDTWVAIGGNRYMSGGRSRIAYSPDGINWTEVPDTTFGTSRSIYGLAWGDDRFIVIGDSDNQYRKTAYSMDGINWTAGPDRYSGGFSSSGSIENITWGNGTWIAARGWMNINTSTDGGMTWNSIIASSSSGAVRKIAWGNGKFVAVGESSMIGVSSDGVTWTVGTHHTAFGNNNPIYTISWGGDKFIACSLDGMTTKMAYSQDGITWTAITDTTFGKNGLITDVTWGNGKWLAVGSGVLK